MNLNELIQQLQRNPALPLALALPDGRRVPPHFHITEVGHVTKRFVDCGGTVRASEAAVLQAHVGSTDDDGHRLTAGKLAKIIGLSGPVLPGGDLPVEVEHGEAAAARYAVEAAGPAGGTLTLRLGAVRTDCLAKDKCGIPPPRAEAPAVETEPAACCAGASGGGRCC
jgi:hypothetical protein